MALQLKGKLFHYICLTRLNKPIGILLLLWPTMWALWISANGMPQIKNVIIFVLGVILMRSAGCVINDFADCSFDSEVERTRERPLATGAVSKREALALFVILIVLAAVLLLFLNTLCKILAVIGLAISIIYPFLKRFTHLPQLVLGLAFAWGVPMTFAAEMNELPIICWMLFLISVLWLIIYDTMYAMADREDDIKLGLRSTAILFGEYDRLILVCLQMLFVSLLFIFGFVAGLGESFYLALMISCGLIVYQQYLIKDREPNACFKAFINNHWLGAIIFLGILFSYF